MLFRSGLPIAEAFMPPAKVNPREIVFRALLWFIAMVLALSPCWLALARPSPQSNEQSTPPITPVTQNTPEMSSQESPTTFHVNVRLVELHVVIRDAHGNAIGTLRKEDFRVFDEGKPQVITKFSLEKLAPAPAPEEKSGESSSTPSTPAPDIPQHYIAYLFDDIHLAFSDLASVREAAEKNLNGLRPTDRAAIFTTSGRNNLDFTDDRNKLHDALLRLMPRSISDQFPHQCPNMTYYIADLIENQQDQVALSAMTADALACQFNNNSRFLSAAQALAQEAARQALILGDQETHVSLISLKDIVRRVAATPGDHSIVLVSPGFITPHELYDVDDIIERAVRANIVINALDARGLYVLVPGGDISQGIASNPLSAAREAQYQFDNASADANVMAELADATGGIFFQNSNDFDDGFRRLASTPEYFYMLGFSPQNLKLNGRYHKLKVTLNTPEKFSVQTRRGYFAPKQAPSSDQQAKQEIEDAVFSQEEMRELPIDLHTQFFKPSDERAKLTILAHVDVKQLRFQKADGRNNSDLTIVSAIFDRNGNFVTGIQKLLQLHLKNDTLAYRMSSGLTVKSNFDVKPGSYLVRLVVRDAQGQIAAENGVVEIP
jgi:VWFA-related protein